ncbi:LysR family transcriptional regulator [Pseudoalteromonas denitrificans]|uniref:LysR family transcriptional regulator, transcriptional activator AphB n=1 Tax=Pseudoalteromonas denitrificans DSM 6059 TaxID=1123010 RepID=A0A1I1PJ99_9GAMM|nr:LysR family transcriptional regulator [Pseudoalteromonas denitrificans]SFD09925.1 LysR family transcriptional regulator, transcriptional activator AphB [Pseudoalteromonas denitrificans DSM 6059]
MTNLNDMMVFLTVVEQGSFTLAAEALALPKSNISRKVSRLEHSLGIRLLERSTRSLHLTEIGQVYFEHCIRIKEELLSANSCIENMAVAPRGNLRICASVTIGQSVLAPLLTKFNQVYPEINIELKLTNRRVDIIEEGYDLVLRVGESSDSSLISKKLLNTQLKLYASPAYIKNNQAINITIHNLPQHKCLFMNAVSQKPVWELSNFTDNKIVNITPIFKSDDFNVIYQMTLAGAGIALLPDYLCQTDIKNNKLVPVIEQWHGQSINLYAIFASRRGVTPKVRVMLDYLETQLGLIKK